MAWTESHQSLLDHRKTLRLARELGIDQVTAIGHLHIFWWWALDNAPDGTLKGITGQDVASAARFLNSSRDSEAFLQALIIAGFVDRRGHGKGRPAELQIHDWEQYGGKLLQSRARHREVVRQSRDRPDQSRSEKSRGDQIITPYSPPKRGTGELPIFRLVSLTDQDPEALKFWGQVLERLKLVVTKPNWETWLKDTVGIAFEGDKVVIGAPTEMAVEWLSAKLRPLSAKEASQLRGSPIEVEFALVGIG